MKQYAEIQTERLTLKRLENSDWKIILFLRSDNTVNQFVKRPKADTKIKALKFIQKINSEISTQNLYYWKITERNKSQMLGSICLWNFSKDYKTAEVGYDLSPNYQGKGIMNESLKNVIEFGFQELYLDSIEAFTHKKNMSSIKLLERNEFQYVEGKKDKQNADNISYQLKKKVSSPLTETINN